MPDIVRACSNCDCWDQPTSECRALPPGISTQGSSSWPTTKPDDWCNKFIRAVRNEEFAKIRATSTV